MNRVWRPLILLFVAVSILAGQVWGQAEGMNAAGVIDFPTAMDQPTTHSFHGSIEIFDLGEPDLRPVNLRYGFQWGIFQLLADTYWQTEPKEYGFSELKAKLRILSLDEYRVYGAIGMLGRFVDKEEKEPVVIDDRRYSLFAILTSELYPVADWDAFLVNFYIDNRNASFGFKIPIYQFIRGVAEADYHHGLNEELEGLTEKQEERWHSKIGIELEGEQNFYAQFYYSTAGEHMRLQIGTGF